jgi:hypothetical protein
MLTPKTSVVKLGNVLFAGVAALVLIVKTGSRSGSRGWMWGGVTMLACRAILSRTSQPVSIPIDTVGGSVSNPTDSTAIDGTQLFAFAYMRTHSSPSIA